MAAEPVYYLRFNAPTSELLRYLDAREPPLMTLVLTNCIVPDSEDLARAVARCDDLRNLQCVASHLYTDDILGLMLESLNHLTHLELSMVSNEQEALEQIEEVRNLSSGDLSDALANKLRYLYVEVDGEANLNLLDAFFARCPKVINFHVHLMGGILETAVSRCSQILASRPLIETFAFTSEVPPSEPLEPPARLDLRHAAAVCANVLYRRQPNLWNIARLSDLASSAERVRLTEPLLVVAVNNPDLDEQIHQAGSLNNWSDVRTLCLVLVAPPEASAVPRAVAGVSCCAALLQLFRGFKHLTELNVNSFHVDQELDLSLILQPLVHLQAVSFAPCGLSHNEALERLSLRCLSLEDLDIRNGPSGRSRACSYCEQELHLTDDDMLILSGRDWQGRLTVNVPKVGSLRFANSLLAELRIIDHSDNPLSEYGHLGELLSKNPNLRSLLLQYKGLNIASSDFQDDIIQITMLRYLCLLSDKVMIESGEGIIRWMATQLRDAEAIHVHYKDCYNSDRQVSWTRPIERPEVLQGLEADEEEHPPLMGRGEVIQRTPCILCPTQTFIGLCKPHNRARRMNP